MRLIRRLGKYFIPYTWHIIFSMLCMSAVAATSGATAWLVKPVLDDIFIHKDEWKLKIIPLAILGMYILKGVCRYLQSYIMRWVGEAVVLKMRDDVMRSIQFRELGFFDRYTTGVLMAMVTSDVGAMQGAIPIIIQMGRTWFTILGLIVVLLKRDWFLSLAAFAVFPLAAYPLNRMRVLMRAYARRAQASIGVLSTILQESFSGIEVVKSFRSEEREIGRFRATGERIRQTTLKIARLSELLAPFMELIGALSLSVIIWYAGRQVLVGKATPGSFFSFMTALFMIYDPLKRAGTFSTTLQFAIASAERVFGLMDTPLGSSEVGGVLTLERPVTSVSFEEVRFTYDEAKGEILHGISFRAKQGEVVALVGPSGGGKSTVLKLLPRFYDPTSGCIRINGEDISHYTVASLRDSIAVVTQDTFLFNDTVKANLVMAKTDVSDEEIERAARAAKAHEFIQALPNGYDTVVGERGDFLSGGQKQRIAIARALLKDAPILILDEATSALDSASEKEVQEALEVLMEGRTTFVIAHRLSTIRHATQILVISEGRIVERGSHQELLDLNGAYTVFCKLQFSGAQEG